MPDPTRTPESVSFLPSAQQTHTKTQTASVCHSPCLHPASPCSLCCYQPCLHSPCSHPPCSHLYPAHAHPSHTHPVRCCWLLWPGCQRSRKQPRLMTNHRAWFCFPGVNDTSVQGPTHHPLLPTQHPHTGHSPCPHPDCSKPHSTHTQIRKRHHPADCCSHLMAAPTEHRSSPYH